MNKKAIRRTRQFWWASAFWHWKFRQRATTNWEKKIWDFMHCRKMCSQTNVSHTSRTITKLKKKLKHRKYKSMADAIKPIARMPLYRITAHSLYMWSQQILTIGGAGTNLKVGGRQMSGAKRRKFFCRAPKLFLALQLQLVVLVSAFVMESTIWSVSCLLFYSRCVPPAQPFVKARAPVPHGVGATANNTYITST